MSLSGVDWLVESSFWTSVWALCSLSSQVELSVYKPHISASRVTVLSACRLTCFQSPGDSFPRLQLKPTSPAFLSCHCYQKADVDAATQGNAKRALDLHTPESLPLPERGNGKQDSSLWASGFQSGTLRTASSIPHLLQAATTDPD